MIPGLVSKMSESTLASAAKIFPMTDIVNLTGAVQVNNIVPALGTAVCQFLVLNCLTGPVILGATGNIAVGLTTVLNRPVFLVFSKAAQKWLINSGV